MGRVIASLQMDIWEDILGKGVKSESLKDKILAMKVKDKNFLNPRLKLTLQSEGNDEETALVRDLGTSAETAWMLQQHLQEHKDEAESRKMIDGAAATPVENISEIMLLAKGCSGPLEKFEGFGKERSVFVGVTGPPQEKKYYFNIWENELDRIAEKAPEDSVELLRISSVFP